VEILEVGQSAPPFSPLHPSQFVLGLLLLWNIIRVDGLVLQFLSEVQQYLRQIVGRTQSVRSRPVVQLPIPLQFHLQPQIFNLEIIGARKPRSMLDSMAALRLRHMQRLQNQRVQHTKNHGVCLH